VQNGFSAKRFRFRDSGGERLAMVMAVRNYAYFQSISFAC
jgi:hypothetical protein